MNGHGTVSHSRRDAFLLLLAVALCSLAGYERFVERETSQSAIDLLLFAPAMLLVAVSRFVRRALLRDLMMLAAIALVGVMLIVRFRA